MGCGATQCGSNLYAYCNYASGQSNISYPYNSGTPCSTCSTGQCANNLCNCYKVCQNYGTLNMQTCKCQCMPYAVGDACEQLMCNKTDLDYGCPSAWNGFKSYCIFSNVIPVCPNMCG